MTVLKPSTVIIIVVNYLFIYAKKPLKASFLIKIVWGMLKNKTI